MDMHAGQQRRFPAVAIAVVLFILCIIPGQAWIAKQFPAISGLAQIKPTLVFLDIPTQLPVTIDLILVPGMFFLIYTVVILLYPARPGILSLRQTLQRVRGAMMGLFALLCCMLTGGLIYYLVQGYLSNQVRNGINTLGLTADIHLAYPGYETIHLQGSMVLLICFFIGLVICIRKIRKEPKAGLTREQRMTPYERMLQEKRMQKKHTMQETQTIQKEEPKVYNAWKPAAIELKTIHSDYNSQSRVCNSQPIMSLKPLAVNYMPMG
jgi:hypothetical protein